MQLLCRLQWRFRAYPWLRQGFLRTRGNGVRLWNGEKVALKTYDVHHFLFVLLWRCDRLFVVTPSYRECHHCHHLHFSHSVTPALLGFRSTVKEDLHCTPAALVYGTTLLLPGDFFQSSKLHNTIDDPLSYVEKLRSAMCQLSTPPPRHHLSVKSHLPDALSSCSHVFMMLLSCHCNHRLLVPFQSWNVAPSTVQWLSMGDNRLYQLTIWSLPSLRG